MKNLNRTLPKKVFLISMSALSIIAFLLIYINYQIAVTNFASAASFDYDLGHKEIAAKNISQNFTDCDCEMILEEPTPLVFDAQVIAVFVGGEGLGVLNKDENSKYQKIYVNLQDLYQGEVGQELRISGKIIGTTCAYANTFFGQCVPDFEADSVEII